MNEYFPTVVQVIPLDNFHEQVLLHGIFLATEMSPGEYETFSVK